MRVTEKNIDQVKVGGWAFQCCECDLQEVTNELIEEITSDTKEGDFTWDYHEKREDAMLEINYLDSFGGVEP